MILLAGFTIIGMLVCVYVSMILALRHIAAWKYFAVGFILFVAAFYFVIGVNNIKNDSLTILLSVEAIIKNVLNSSGCIR